VYDLTNAESFHDLDRFMEMFIDTCAHGELGHFPVLLVGNKSDLEGQIDGLDADVTEWANANQVQLHFHVSAKTGANVEEAFAAFLTEVIRPRPLDRPPRMELTQPPQEKGCC
jgi:GTPase SAR1 family protein